MQEFNYEAGRAYLSGEIHAPASKSVLQRALAAAYLAGGGTVLHGYTPSSDVDAAMDIITKFGCKLIVRDNVLNIHAENRVVPSELHTVESGLSTRLFTPIAALSGKKIAFTGSGSILKRSMDFMQDTLKPFGVELETSGGFMPYSISGKLQHATASIDGSQSSQLLSGLLMALPLLEGKSEIKVRNLASKPYIDLTLEVMNEFGVKVENFSYERFVVQGIQQYKTRNYSIEADWSGGAFWFVAAAINGNLQISGLKPNSAQADVKILDVLKLAGVSVRFERDVYLVEKSSIKAFEFDATHCPDLFPPLAVLAAYASGISIIKGVSRLFGKESNRALAIQTEFQKQGISVDILGDDMHIHGGKVIGGQELNSYNDHRMAMAGAILALNAENKIMVKNAGAVSKSYPDFYNHLESLFK